MSVTDSHRKGGRLWSQIGSGEASRLFTSYFLFSCLQPLPVLPLAAVSDVSAPRVTGSITGNITGEEFVCVKTWGNLSVYKNDLQKCAIKNQILLILYSHSLPCISY